MGLDGRCLSAGRSYRVWGAANAKRCYGIVVKGRFTYILARFFNLQGERVFMLTLFFSLPPHLRGDNKPTERDKPEPAGTCRNLSEPAAAHRS